MTPDTLLIVAGSFVGGFVNGLTGFGTALTAMPCFLLAVSPATAAMLAAALSVAGHVQTLPAIWRYINWPRALPLIGGGLIGLPCGTLMLPQVSVPLFKLFVGLVLIGYCSFMLLGGARLKVSGTGRRSDVAIGVGGGVMAGLSALSGPLPIIWASLQGWSKDERRGVFQAYNFMVLAAMLAASTVAGLMTSEFARALAWGLPGAVSGTFIGVRVYRRLDDRRFDRLVLALLLVAGIALVVSSQPSWAS
jgi:uncharacterized membrane protein YfcA